MGYKKLVRDWETDISDVLMVITLGAIAIVPILTLAWPLVYGYMTLRFARFLHRRQKIISEKDPKDNDNYNILSNGEKYKITVDHSTHKTYKQAAKTVNKLRNNEPTI